MSFAPGTSLNTLTKPAFTREQLKEYAEASGDHNPIHLDETFAKEAGFPSVIVHGMLSMSYLGDLVRFNFPEKDYLLLRFKTRFRKVTFPDDVLVLEGEVKQLTSDGTIFVTLRAKNQKGETTTDGEAEVRPLQ